MTCNSFCSLFLHSFWTDVSNWVKVNKCSPLDLVQWFSSQFQSLLLFKLNSFSAHKIYTSLAYSTACASIQRKNKNTISLLTSFCWQTCSSGSCPMRISIILRTRCDLLHAMSFCFIGVRWGCMCNEAKFPLPTGLEESGWDEVDGTDNVDAPDKPPGVPGLCNGGSPGPSIS